MVLKHLLIFIKNLNFLNSNTEFTGRYTAIFEQISRGKQGGRFKKRPSSKLYTDFKCVKVRGGRRLSIILTATQAETLTVKAKVYHFQLHLCMYTW